MADQRFVRWLTEGASVPAPPQDGPSCLIIGEILQDDSAAGVAEAAAAAMGCREFGGFV